MSWNTHSSKTKFIIDLAKEQALNDKDIPFSKENNELFFQSILRTDKLI